MNTAKISIQNQNNPDFLEQALKTVQEGLKSMRNLQTQTAETHKLFLETQAETGRTLRKMMESTKHLLDSSFQGGNFSDMLDKAGRYLSDIKGKIGIETRYPANPNYSEITEENQVLTELRKNSSAVFEEKEPPSGEIEKILLSTVSRLTGYPEETLSLEMDLEADLGIDSIKKVEIFSCLEEKIPGINSILPETMGGLKTLRKITEYLAGCSRNTNKPDTQPVKTVLKQEAVQNSLKKETVAGNNVKNILLSTIS